MLFHTCLSRVACKSITRAAESWSVGSRLPLLSLLSISVDFSVPSFCIDCCCCCCCCCGCCCCCCCCWPAACSVSFCPITTLHSECLARIACPASPRNSQQLRIYAATWLNLYCTRYCECILMDATIEMNGKQMISLSVQIWTLLRNDHMIFFWLIYKMLWFKIEIIINKKTWMKCGIK